MRVIAKILAWLQDAGGVADWRALDDAAFEFPNVCPELIWCDPNVGLDDAVAQRLRIWLAGT